VFDKTQAVGAYRQLALVDRAFRQLKTVALEIRPVYHQLDQRIEAQVFLCMLAYYLQSAS
jgi:transposase